MNHIAAKLKELGLSAAREISAGEDLTERKFIHIEPYWRGDPDSPIALRTHLLGAK